MRQTRRDPTTGRWTLVSTERVERPVHLDPRGEPPVSAADCPFCPGHEAVTGPAIDQVGKGDAWTVRCVPNKYPAVSAGEASTSRAVGPYDLASGTGAHEVIVEGREHAVPLWRQPVARTAESLRLARRRFADLYKDFRLLHLLWFRNHGQDAGASQAHAHAQLMALPFVPRQVEDMVALAQAHRRDRGRDLLGDLVQADLDEQRRVVWRDDEIVAVCPWAPSATFEVWLVPVREGQHFREATDAQIEGLARGLHFVLGALARELENPPHNVVLYDAPRDLAPRSGFRWHLRVKPRLEPGGGYENGFDGSIVSVPPEETAAILRGDG